VRHQGRTGPRTPPAPPSTTPAASGAGSNTAANAALVALRHRFALKLAPSRAACPCLHQQVPKAGNKGGLPPDQWPRAALRAAARALAARLRWRVGRWRAAPSPTLSTSPLAHKQHPHTLIARTLAPITHPHVRTPLALPRLPCHPLEAGHVCAEAACMTNARAWGPCAVRSNHLDGELRHGWHAGPRLAAPNCKGHMQRTQSSSSALCHGTQCCLCPAGPPASSCCSSAPRPRACCESCSSSCPVGP
jgi:hypothetical protein